MRNPHHSKKFFIIINRRERGAQAEPQPCCLPCGRMVAVQKRSQVVTKAVWHDALHRLAPPGLDAPHPVSLKNCNKQLHTKARLLHNKQGKRFCDKLKFITVYKVFISKNFVTIAYFSTSVKKIILGIQNLKFQYLDSTILIRALKGFPVSRLRVIIISYLIRQIKFNIKLYIIFIRCMILFSLRIRKVNST